MFPSGTLKRRPETIHETTEIVVYGHGQEPPIIQQITGVTPLMQQSLDSPNAQ